MFVATCLLLLIFLITAYAMGMELKENTARQLVAAAGGNPFISVVGKMLPHIAIWLVVMGAYMVYTFGVLHFPHPGGWGVIVLLTVLSVLASVGFGVFMFGLLPALRMSMSLCSLWGVLSFSMVGTAFPVLAMDAPLQVLANIFPMSHVFLTVPYTHLQTDETPEHIVFRHQLEKEKTFRLRKDKGTSRPSLEK